MLTRLVERELDGVDAARLARADADCREALGDHDRIRADVLADAPREQEISPQLLARLAPRNLHPLAVLPVPVAVLHEQSAEHALEITLAAREAAAFLVAQDPDRLLLLQRRERAVLVFRGEQDVDESLGKRLAETGGDGPVHRADHAER